MPRCTTCSCCSSAATLSSVTAPPTDSSSSRSTRGSWRPRWTSSPRGRRSRPNPDRNADALHGTTPNPPRRPTMGFHRSARVPLLALVLALTPFEARAQNSALPAELQSVRALLDKYNDPIVAVHDGFLSTLGCVEYPKG